MWRAFQPGGEDPARARGRAPATLDEGGEGQALACGGCRRRVTTGAARVEIGGGHEHTCTNPGGFSYRIGCFAWAENLTPLGAPSTYWSWFPGMSWQVQHCATCRRHLGWRFASADGGFYGLILDALVEISGS